MKVGKVITASRNQHGYDIYKEYYRICIPITCCPANDVDNRTTNYQWQYFSFPGLFYGSNYAANKRDKP